uniref:Secreted protein n=1 Tax=Mycobacterium kansasii TaxID=1768 RepID=A0A653F4A7_MYCKA|nr:hypothetical protein BIN_B_04433 [Mycobacterium kansasii]
MFSGLTSRCVTPVVWAASSALAIWRTIATARAGLNGPDRFSSVAKSVPSTSRISRNSLPSISP